MDWLCPICALKRFKYGEDCPTWKTTCENRDKAHATGEWYLREQGQVEAKAVGIAAISDEDKPDGES